MAVPYSSQPTSPYLAIAERDKQVPGQLTGAIFDILLLMLRTAALLEAVWRRCGQGAASTECNIVYSHAPQHAAEATTDQVGSASSHEGPSQVQCTTRTGPVVIWKPGAKGNTGEADHLIGMADTTTKCT